MCVWCVSVQVSKCPAVDASICARAPLPPLRHIVVVNACHVDLHTDHERGGRGEHARSQIYCTPCRHRVPPRNNHHGSPRPRSTKKNKEKQFVGLESAVAPGCHLAPGMPHMQKVVRTRERACVRGGVYGVGFYRLGDGLATVELPTLTLKAPIHQYTPSLSHPAPTEQTQPRAHDHEVASPAAGTAGAWVPQRTSVVVVWSRRKSICFVTSARFS